MKHIYPLALLAALSILLISGSSLRASDTDERIEISAKNSYVFKTYLKDDAIKIDSQNGIVTLTGSVAAPFHKSMAQDTVENLPGVKIVNNQLTVKGESPAEHSDAWIGTKVKTTLLYHRNVRGTKTEVNVKDGVVTLTGEASSLAQKELTTEYAKDVEGVKAVKNLMTVAKSAASQTGSGGEKVDDASITAQVKASLLAHRSTSALQTKVTTTEGVVTISGEAKNAAEKSLVTKLATDIEGVKNVINNMTIASVTTK